MTTQPRGALEAAVKAVRAYDNFCFLQPMEYPTKEQLADRKLLFSTAAGAAINYVRALVSAGAEEDDNKLPEPFPRVHSYDPSGARRTVTVQWGEDSFVSYVRYGDRSTWKEIPPINETPVERPAPSAGVGQFQDRVSAWMLECFTETIADDMQERADRLIEEVLELVQSHGYDPRRVAALTDYVFNRPAGEPTQEVGGVMVTLAAYCRAAKLNMHDAGETELARILRPEIIAKIRAKQAAKPTGSALPIAAPPASAAGGGPDNHLEKMTMNQLPEHDASKSKNDQGLYRKFEVNRTDGSDAPGGKHHGCEYFVLDITHDKFAAPALLAYADACESEYPELATDLRERYKLAAQGGSDK